MKKKRKNKLYCMLHYVKHAYFSTYSGNKFLLYFFSFFISGIEQIYCNRSFVSENVLRGFCSMSYVNYKIESANFLVHNTHTHTHDASVSGLDSTILSTQLYTRETVYYNETITRCYLFLICTIVILYSLREKLMTLMRIFLYCYSLRKCLLSILELNCTEIDFTICAFFNPYTDGVTTIH